MTASLHRLLNGLDIRDLTKLRRRRERERQTSNSFNEQNNSARASRFFLANFYAVSAQQGREMANFLSLLENGNGKAINSTVRGPLSSAPT